MLDVTKKFRCQNIEPHSYNFIPLLVTIARASHPVVEFINRHAATTASNSC